jgi:hypothetical protein
MSATLNVFLTERLVSSHSISKTKDVGEEEEVSYTWEAESIEPKEDIKKPDLTTEYGFMNPSFVQTRDGLMFQLTIPEGGHFVASDRTLILKALRNLWNRKFVYSRAQTTSGNTISLGAVTTVEIPALTEFIKHFIELLNANYRLYGRTKPESSSALPLTPIIPHAVPRTIETDISPLDVAEILKLIVRSQQAKEGDGKPAPAPYMFVFAKGRSEEAEGEASADEEGVAAAADTEPVPQTINVREIMEDQKDYTMVAAFTNPHTENQQGLWFERVHGSYVPREVMVGVLRHVLVDDEMMIQPLEFLKERLKRIGEEEAVPTGGKVLRTGEKEMHMESAPHKMDKALLLLSETSYYHETCQFKYTSNVIPSRV